MPDVSLAKETIDLSSIAK